MSLLQNSNAIEGGDYNLENSLRFRASATAYLNRTPATAGNRKTWTWSGWVKRGNFGTVSLFNSEAGGGTTQGRIVLDASNKLGVVSYISGLQLGITTAAIYRDPSAWYHIVIVLDTTQAVSTDRIKIYVNGEQITSFSGTTTYPSLNYDGAINNNILHQVGRHLGAEYFDGYLTEVNFVDGQALTPSDFGETNEDTGVWQPIEYTGTYGTNGFYLKGRGTDNSGNGNNWTENNFNTTTSTATTYDIMTDVPTLTYEDTANFAVINPLAFPAGTTGLSSSNGNLTYTNTNGANAYPSYATFYAPSGKFYFEATITARGGASDYGYIGANNVYYANTGKKQSLAAYGSSWTTGDIIGVAIDNGVGVTFYKNNVSQGLIATTEIHFPRWAGFNGTIYDINFGQRPFAYTPPAGYKKLNTYNLPDSSIVEGSENMDAVTYTGQTVSSNFIDNGDGTWSQTGLNFQPDLVWIKQRSGTAYHNVYDSLRIDSGDHKRLYTNTTNAEESSTYLGTTNLTSFDSGGFSVGSGSDTNNSGSTYVAWNWKAGGAPTTTNTAGVGAIPTAGSVKIDGVNSGSALAGSIAATNISANTTAGFSVVTYTGNGSANQSVGHGLTQSPEIKIIKDRVNGTYNWTVTGSLLGTDQKLFLNTTAASSASVGYYPLDTASVLSISGVNSAAVYNTSGNTYIAYAFHSVEGYSKFGSYTGNGSADGPFVYTGFRPAFVMRKRTDSSGSWRMHDSERNTYNVANLNMVAEASQAEASSGNEFDMLSNGFKCRATNGDTNGSGATYIYMAFAENPFKNSLAR